MEKLKLNDGVGGRALDGGWAGICNEENDKGLVTPRSRRSIWVRVSSRKTRLCWREMGSDGRKVRVLEGSTVDEASDAAQRAKLADLGLQPRKGLLVRLALS